MSNDRDCRCTARVRAARACIAALARHSRPARRSLRWRSGSPGDWPTRSAGGSPATRPTSWHTMAHFVYEAQLPCCCSCSASRSPMRVRAATRTRVAPYAMAAIVAAVAGRDAVRRDRTAARSCHVRCTMDRWAHGSPQRQHAARQPPHLRIRHGRLSLPAARRSSGSARLRARELERAQLTRRTIESRLQAMQACIEPQFLFDTLAAGRAPARDRSRSGRIA